MDDALRRLLRDGLLAAGPDRHRTTPKWQGAMARAALRLYEAQDPGTDLRVPIALALVQLYGPQTPEADLVELVEAILPFELRALGLSPGDRARPHP